MKAEGSPGCSPDKAEEWAQDRCLTQFQGNVEPPITANEASHARAHPCTATRGGSARYMCPKTTAHAAVYGFLLTVLGRTVHFFFSTSCSAASLARLARMPKRRALARAMRRLAKALKFFSSSEMTRAFSRLKTCGESARQSACPSEQGAEASQSCLCQDQSGNGALVPSTGPALSLLRRHLRSRWLLTMEQE